MEIKKYQKEKVLEIIRDVAALSPEDTIGEEEEFEKDLCLDSLDSIYLIMRIEKEFSIRMPDDKLEKIVTIKDAFKLLETYL